jgi:RNA polymerase sigma factor (TIGR02999 family)
MADAEGSGDLTMLLARVGEGDARARDRFFDAVYVELKRLAGGHLRRQGTLTNLDSTSLVHEAFLRFVQRGNIELGNRRIFFGYASQVMRSVIIDYVRERAAKKRGGGVVFQTLVTGYAGDEFAFDEIEPLHEALKDLQRIDQRLHDVVEMRYFGGLSIEEVAEVMGVSSVTVKRDWQKARAYLFKTIRNTEKSADSSPDENPNSTEKTPDIPPET